MRARTPVPGASAVDGRAGSAPQPTGATPSRITGGERLALAVGLRARGLRGLDVLRRSQDRAPPGVR